MCGLAQFLGFAGLGLGFGIWAFTAKQERQTAAYDFSLVLLRFTSVDASSHKLARVQRALQRAYGAQCRGRDGQEQAGDADDAAGV